MEYITVKETGLEWAITSHMANFYCSTGKIAGIIKKGGLWLISPSAEKPSDGRIKKELKK